MNSEYDSGQIHFRESKTLQQWEKFGMGQKEEGKQNMPQKGDTSNTHKEVDKDTSALITVCVL